MDGKKPHRSPFLVAVVTLGALLLVSSGPVAGQFATDLNGYILDDQWIALGSFENGVGCSPDAGDLLLAFTGETPIHCQYPEGGDEIAYDPATAASSAYNGPVGPNGDPQWRQFTDDALDCRLNFDADLDNLGDFTDEITYVATYVQWDGAAPTEVVVCMNSDDQGQVWIDGELVMNSTACSPDGDCAAGLVCDNTAEFTITPGVHRLLFGVWERAGGWGGSLRLLQNDGLSTPIVDGDADWTFLGADPAGIQPPPCFELPTREVQLPDCNGLMAVGLVQVTISAPLAGANPADTVTVEETVTAANPQIGSVTNGGASAAIISPDDGIDRVTGAVLEFFVLGPIANPGGASPGEAAIRAGYLSIPDDDVGTLNEGDTVDDVDGTPQTVRRLSVNNGDALDYNQVGGGGDNIMHYAWTKLTLTQPKLVSVAVNADDSVQVLVNGDEVTIHNGGQGFGGVGTSEWGGLVSLPAGTHTILTKTYEGGGGHGVRLILREVPDTGVGAGGPDCDNATPIAPGQTGVGSTSGGDIGTSCDADDVAPANYYVVEGTGAIMRAETCNPVFIYDTWLAVFDSAPCDDPFSCLVSNDDTCGRQSVVEWDSVAGQNYFIRISGWNDRRGVYFVRVSDENTPAAAPIVATPLSGASVCADPDGNCDPAAEVVSGLEITWANVTRQALANGIGYTVDINQGVVQFTGRLGSLPVRGASQVEVCPSPTNPGTGQIREPMWAGLGPFEHLFGCAGPARDLLSNHIAPDRIDCAYPSIGDEADYDEFEASTEAYSGPTGPNGGPVWRVVDDGNGDGFIILDDALANRDDVMAWLVTYVENVSGGPLAINFCFGSDDNGQILVDNEFVHTISVCRGSGGCQDVIPYNLSEGMHAIKMAAWDRGGGWNINLAIQRQLDGTPIVGGDPELNFLGPNKPAGFQEPECSMCELEPVTDLTCEPGRVGLGDGIILNWTNPAVTDPLIMTRIQINGVEVATVESTATTAGVPSGLLPAGLFDISVIHCGGVPAFCSPFNTTDAGQIMGQAWLALGPFANAFGCSDSGDDLLQNFIGPENHIACEFPADGDPLKGYDPFDLQVASDNYHLDAPVDAGGNPIWRPFQDSTPTNGDLDFDQDVVGNLEDHLLWVATWVEYTGADPVDLQFCIGSDDQVQVWVDQDLVHNFPAACNPRGDCDGIAFYTMEPGVHVIKGGVWERAGGWGFRFSMSDAATGEVITDGDPDFVFHGRNQPDGFTPPDCDVCPAVGNLTCTQNANGSVDVSWDASECEGAIRILAYGEEVGMVANNETSFTIPAADFPFPGSVSVDNGSFTVSSCTLIEATEFHTDLGFISAWLHLGPYAQQDGANPGCALMQMDHLTDGQTTELDIEPQEGDQIETDFALAASLGLNPAEACFDCNPGDVPTWFAFFDVGDQFDVNSLVSGGDNQMSYGMFYIDVPQDITVDVGVASDDAIQVLAAPVGEDLVEIHCNSVARGGGGANQVQDAIPGVALTAGQWKFMVKVFEGDGGHNWRLRFQSNGVPLVPGEVSLEPGGVPRERNCADGEDNDGDGAIDCADSDCSTAANCQGGFVRGDADSNGSINLTDGIVVLNFLFLGAAAPACLDAADTDDQGNDRPSLTDAVIIFSWLFSGGDAPRAPSPMSPSYAAAECRPDPTPNDGMDCAVRSVTCGG